MKADYWAIFDLPDHLAPGLDAVAIAQQRIDAFAQRWRDSYPAAVRALLADRESLTVYLRLPARALEPHPALQLHIGLTGQGGGDSPRQHRVPWREGSGFILRPGHACWGWR